MGNKGILRLGVGAAALIVLVGVIIGIRASAGGSAPSGGLPGDGSFRFESLHTDYQLTKDASGHADLAVTETFQARFPAAGRNHGIERAIPRTSDGRSLHVRVYDVNDGAGHAVPFRTSTHGGFTVLRIGDPHNGIHGIHTYVIDYSLRDVVRQPAFSSAQRFDVDVNGTGWAQSFGRVDATLRIPAALASSLTADDHCVRSGSGSTATCELTRSYAGFQASATGLGPHENVGMVVGFKPGTFAVPVPRQQVLAWVLLGVAVLLIASALVVFLRRFRRRKAVQGEAAPAPADGELVGPTPHGPALPRR